LIKKLFNRGVFIFLAWSCCLNSALSDDRITIEIRTIGIPPYGIQNNTHPSGVYFDTANLIAKEAGYQANNYIYPYARIINELKTGETDLTIMFKYKELEGDVIYIAPLKTLKTVVVGLKGNDFNSLSSLKGKTLAYLRGAKFSDAIDNDPDIQMQVTNDFVGGIKMLMFHRVDAIIGPLDPIQNAAREANEGRDILGQPLIVSERTPWVQISKKSTNRISAEKLKAAFSNIEDQGRLATIRDRYKPVTYSQ